MSTAETKERTAEASTRFNARIACVFYLVTILAAGIVLFVHGSLRLIVDLVAAACYIAVTVFFHHLSR